jgi:hypothetical protein
VNRGTSAVILGILGLILVVVIYSIVFAGTSVSTILSKVGSTPHP